MVDLVLAATVVIGLAVAVYLAAVSLSARMSLQARNRLAFATVLCGGMYLTFLWDDIVLSRVLPISSVAVLGNWIPMFAAVLVAIATNEPRLRAAFVRRTMLTGSVGVVCAVSVAWPLMRATPSCGNEWAGSTCLQTTDVTCSPAAAATLLAAYGIDATEQEMAELCLTRHSGTSWMGLYRGLALKTRGTPWRVEITSGDISTLRSSTDRPVILFAELGAGEKDDAQLRETCGWIPGQSHAVVFFNFLSDDVLRMGDPSFGPELWKKRDLHKLWTGQLVRLVPR